MLTWGQFAGVRPDLAEDGRSLLYQYGVGLAFLATVRRDGGPRLHPMCPLVTVEGIYGFLTRSPKLADLRRDGRYAMHAFPADQNEDAFSLSGTVRLGFDEARRTELATAFAAERGLAAPTRRFGELTLVEFLIERCLLTRTAGHGDDNPQHTVWPAPGT